MLFQVSKNRDQTSISANKRRLYEINMGRQMMKMCRLFRPFHSTVPKYLIRGIYINSYNVWAPKLQLFSASEKQSVIIENNWF